MSRFPNYNEAIHSQFDAQSYPRYVMRGDGKLFDDGPLCWRWDTPQHGAIINVDGTVHDTFDSGFDQIMEMIGHVYTQVSPLYIIAAQMHYNGVQNA